MRCLLALTLPFQAEGHIDVLFNRPPPSPFSLSQNHSPYILSFTVSRKASDDSRHYLSLAYLQDIPNLPNATQLEL